jgi:tetratricopeptide (TPR) repeat protein
MKLPARLFCSAFLLTLVFDECLSQAITTPREASPAASVSQTIGISTTTIKYSRPSVKGRKVWGELVPFGWNVQTFGLGNQAPWRAGANENTTITFSHDAKVEGISVPAGTYGLFFVINEDNSGEVILSKNSKAWGSFFYESERDQMKAAIKIRDNNFQQLLTYDFINLTEHSGELVLSWEKKQFPVKIEFAVNEIVIANAKEELQGPIGFTAEGFISAAFYSFKYNVDLDQGMKWIDQALAMEPSNFDAIRVKARILVRNGNATEADKLLNDGLQSASENELTLYGYQLMQSLGLYDKAIKVFLVGTQRFPKSANAWDSLGEAYALKGDKENAIKNFKKALTLNPSKTTKENSEKYLKQLGAI